MIGLAFGAGPDGENVGVFRSAVAAGRDGEIIDFLRVDDMAVTAGEAVGVFEIAASHGTFVLAQRRRQVLDVVRPYDGPTGDWTHPCNSSHALRGSPLVADRQRMAFSRRTGLTRP